jgi:hypothetical protein
VISFLCDFFERIFNQLLKILESTGKAVIEEIERIFKKIINDLGHGIGIGLKDFFQFIEKIIVSLSNGLEEILKIIFYVLKNVSTDVLENLVKLGEYIFNRFRFFEHEIYEELKKIFKEIEDEKVLEDLEHIAQKNIDNLLTLYKDINDLVFLLLNAEREYEGDEALPLKLKYKTIGLIIVLNSEDPAIISFTENPDELESIWPMLKMELNEFDNLSSPPKIEKLQISVEVEGSSNFVMYNDFGALDAKKPFQIFGVTAEKDQSFYLGSNEVFSKPTTRLDFELDWDNLPNDDFGAYYEQYNRYLNHDFDKIPSSEECKELDTAANSIFSFIFDGIINIFNFIFSFKREAITPDPNPIPIPNPNPNPNTDTNSQFYDESFTVSFDQLSNSLWSSFKQDFSNNTLYRSFFFPCIEEDIRILLNQSYFQCGTYDNKDSINSNPNPLLQLNPLEFSGTVRDGFLRMELTSEYGFGSTIYPPIVSKIALYNADIIAESIKDSGYKCSPTSPPNLPYVPTVGAFKGNYNASCEYDFKLGNIDYPIECYYYTPFNKYKVYDNKSGLEILGTTLGSPTKSSDNNNLLPFYPAFDSQGQLFISLENLIAPNPVSFYFELTRNSSIAETLDGSVSHFYLNENGWESLEILSDETSNISCSGVMTVNVPTTITDTYLTFPSGNQWISLSVKENPEFYSETSFIKTNGFKLVRTGDNYLEDVKVPQIASDIITGPDFAIPQIESITQPFPSFGGKAKETDHYMYKRTSTRLKIKDRVIASEDYYRTIQLNFIDIYFSKVAYNSFTNETEIFLVKRVNDWKETNAFLPLVNNCKEQDVLSYLECRASGLVNLKVLNFEIKYVKIVADIVVANGYSLGETSKLINQQLNIYISPWIKTSQDQIKIDSGINTSEIANFLKKNIAISDIKNIQLKIGTKDAKTGVVVYECLGVQEIAVADKDSQENKLKEWCEVISQISLELSELFCDSNTQFDSETIWSKVRDVVEIAYTEINQEVSLVTISDINNEFTKELINYMDVCDFNSIKKIIEKICMQLGVCNTAYINKKTLLVPSLDDKLIKFTDS